MRFHPHRRAPEGGSPLPAQRADKARRRTAALRPFLAAVVTTSLALAVSAVTAQSAAAVPGLRFGTATSPTNAAMTKRVVATCPDGTVGVGVGGVHTGDRDVRITELNVARVGAVVTASVQEGAPARNWFLHVTARCAPESSLPGLEYMPGSSSVSSAAAQSAQASCRPGKQAIGMGGVIGVSGSAAGPEHRELALTAVRAGRDLTQVNVRAHEDETGFGGNWRVHAIAVCVNPRPGQRLVDDFIGSDSTSLKNVRTRCPSGAQIHSLGFDVTSARGQAHVSSAFLSTGQANDPRQAAEVQASEDRTGFSGNWRLLTLGICAN